MDPLLFALALLVRTFVFQPFNVPSRSMEPSIVTGDIVLANKMAYGYSRFSPPQWIARAFLLPHGRIAAFSPRRGDVVIFRRPGDETTDFIKRIVGLPGDTVQLVRGRLVVNGAIAPRQALAAYPTTFVGGRTNAPRYREALPGGASHDVIEAEGDEGMLDDTPLVTVPPDSYFVLGDNRDNSLDSRVSRERGGVGFGPRDNLIGQVRWVLFSTPGADNHDHGGFRFLTAVP